MPVQPNDPRNKKKEYNRDRPFSRIENPNFGETGPKGEAKINGLGYDCGCNNEDDYPFAGVGIVAALFTALKRLMNTAPSWVPVLPSLGLPEEEREVQGLLAKSFQTWTDVPIHQYHYYYDWNFHLSPDPGYEFYRGQANEEAELTTTPATNPKCAFKPCRCNAPTGKTYCCDWCETEDNEDLPQHTCDCATEARASEGKHGVCAQAVVLQNQQQFTEQVRMEAVIKGANMECEWDVGAFGKRPGAMFRAHWQWPMTAEQVWCTGRLIYDCGHPSSLETDPKKSNVGRMRSELHPLKAAAGARWEAESFPENNGKYVPAIKFMFFACKSDGYYKFASLNDKDYVFLVDLPQIDKQAGPFDIGHTPRYRKNTIRLRPRLLVKFDTTPFETVMHETPMKDIEEPLPHLGNVTPVVELPPDFDPEKPQAKVTIPLTGLGSGDDAYGVIISLGWYAPDVAVSSSGGQATQKKIKQFTVTFDKVVAGSAVHTPDALKKEDDGETTTFTMAEEWFLKMCVNGRWFWYYSTKDTVSPGRVIQFTNLTHTFFLSEDDTVRISAHGAQRNNVDDVMWRNQADRTIETHSNLPIPILGRILPAVIDPQPVEYVRDIQNGSVPGPPTRGNKSQRLPKQQMVFREIAWNMRSNRDQNAPLGLIDIAIPAAKFADGKQQYSQNVFYTSEVGTSAELATTRQLVDYTLFYTIEVKTIN